MPGMRKGEIRRESCETDLGGGHACYLNRNHTGPHQCSPDCDRGHPKAPYAWVYRPGIDRNPAKARARPV